MQTCNISSLEPYIPSPQQPWNEQRVAHLYRRLTYGENANTLNDALEQNPQSLVTEIIDNAQNTTPTPAPSWGYKYRSDYQNEGKDFEDENNKNRIEWFRQTVKDQHASGLHGMMTSFWHNHFVTQISQYNISSYMFQYYNVLQRFAMGNFKTFVHEIGLTYAMLRYLNGFQNRKNRPNENYARELYELFSLGENNGYTQNDITETAKALTGYNKGRYGEKIEFDAQFFNDSEKTIFGQTGNWNYDDVIDILFRERKDQIAKFIVTKLYAYFISPELNSEVINELSGDFAKDFEITPILRKLFASKHFFDDKAIGTLIKSPYDLAINFWKTIDYTLTDDRILNIYWQTLNQGQQFFNPVDVAGWQGDYKWINTSTITTRWTHTGYLVWFGIGNNVPEEIRSQNQRKLVDLAVRISGNSTDADLVTRKVVDTFIPNGLPSDQDYENAAAVFKDRYPENYYTDGIWNLQIEGALHQVRELLFHIIRLPEFQIK